MKIIVQVTNNETVDIKVRKDSNTAAVTVGPGTTRSFSDNDADNLCKYEITKG